MDAKKRKVPAPNRPKGGTDKGSEPKDWASRQSGGKCDRRVREGGPIGAEMAPRNGR